MKRDGARILRMIESEAAMYSDINAFAGWIESVCKCSEPLKKMDTKSLETLYHDIGVELRERDERAA